MLGPPVEAMGYELADLDARIGGRNGLLRLYIDKASGVTLDDCERVSHQIGALLDVEEPIPGAYTLEVSSPGLNRRLWTPEQFQRFAGSLVKVKMRMQVQGQRNFRGRLSRATEEHIWLEVETETQQLKLSDIEMARIVPEFES